MTTNQHDKLWRACAAHALSHFTGLPDIVRQWFIDGLLTGRLPESNSAVLDGVYEYVYPPDNSKNAYFRHTPLALIYARANAETFGLSVCLADVVAYAKHFNITADDEN